MDVVGPAGDLESALVPYGESLEAFYRGDAEAELVIRRDDGYTARLPVAHFFRSPRELTPLERAALDRCADNVLDVGAGTGLLALPLENGGARVTALDACAAASRIMRARGLRDVRCGDALTFAGGVYDTVLMMGHGVGLVGDLARLDRWLVYARALLRSDGELLLDSLDVRRTDDAVHLDYHRRNREAGRYEGETRIRFEFGGRAGPFRGWLHVDADTLAEHASRAGWRCARVLETSEGEYLASLTL